MKRSFPGAAQHYGPGYVYVASNEFMPGLVKIGRTGGLVRYRLQSLYATGVPARFKAEGERFFAEVHESERLMHEALCRLGKRCPNREFYEVSTTIAVDALENMYESQHERIRPDIFEWQIEEAFEKFLSTGNITSAEHTLDIIVSLPEERRVLLMLQLLAHVMHRGVESYAMWLVCNWGVDPQMPIKNPRHGTGIPRYDLTAFEYSILLGLTKFERYLARHGCDLRNSTVLSLLIDVMINGPRNFDSLSRCADFAVALIDRGACIHWPLTGSLFSEARRKATLDGGFNFDLYPRNSDLSCLEIAAQLAPTDRWFAKVYRAMVGRI